MPRVRKPYDLTRRLLYGDGKTELSRKTGIALRTLHNRREKPQNTTARELALIAKAKGMDAEQIALVLNDLAKWG